MPGEIDANEPARTWASGRKLSEAERARKREVDRRTKAANRQRERQKVIELEAKLADLTQRHVAQQSHVSELLQAIEHLKGENERYRLDLSILRDAKVQTGQGSANSDVLRAETAIPVLNSGLVEADGADLALGSSPTITSDPLDTKMTVGDDLSGPNFATSAEQTTIDPTELSVPPPPDTTNTTISQRLIESARKVNSIPLEATCLDDIENQDSLIRIALTGNVGKSMNCPAWDRMIETFDQCIQYCGTTERFVMLRMIHQMMLFQIARRSGHKLALPDWYKPRPVQMRVPHEDIADYFAWPSFRERLVFSLSAISTDDFWISFANNFQYCGPFVTLENILHLGADGKYSFAPSFENDMRNFKYWRMRLEFFDQFPELYDFMVPLEPLPKQMSNSNLHDWQWPNEDTKLVRRRSRRVLVPKAKDKELSTRPSELAPALQMHYILSSESS